MKITIEPDLATSSEHFFAYPYKQFKNQNDTTVLLTVPLQQREYEWGRFSEDNNNIENLLEDLDYHISNHSDKYFAGTILLENQIGRAHV